MRFFIGCLLLMVYILTLSYKGSLNAVLTVSFFPKPMDTLEEIAAQVCKLLSILIELLDFLNDFLQDLPIGSIDNTQIRSMKESVDINVQKIAEKSFPHYDFEAAFHNASANRIIMVQSQRFLEYNLRKRFTNK